MAEAFDRHGFVTRAGALREGYSPNALRELIVRGALEKVAHGVYRMPVVPATEFDNLHLAVLWTGVENACLSHETALAVYELGDVNPDRVNVTVPRGRRIRRSGAEGVEVHHHDLEPDQIGWFEQIPTVTPMTAIIQCIDTGTPTYLVREALSAARDLGHITADEGERLGRRLDVRGAAPR